MNYIVVSDNGAYKIAHIIETHKNNLIVELLPDNCKRNIATKHQIYPVTPANINDFARLVEERVQSIDVGLLWELVETPTDKMSIQALAQIYFGDPVDQVALTALLFALERQGIDFQNHGTGEFTRRDDEERAKWLAIQERKLAEAAAYDAVYNKVMAAYNNGAAIAGVDIDLSKLLFKPDKHSSTYKVFNNVSRELKISILELCYKLGLMTDLPQFFVDSFMAETFPHGRFKDWIPAYAGMTPIEVLDEGSIVGDDNSAVQDDEQQVSFQRRPESRLPDDKVATVWQDNLNLAVNSQIDVFSIDDSSTTEIDDAFSVQKTDTGYRIGVHIAAPALDPGLADIVGDNISTIYYPGSKITMLPEAVIEYYSLHQGATLPVVSIYFDIDHDLVVQQFFSAVELVTIKTNLRIETLETLFTTDNLAKECGYPYENELKLLYQFALKLEEKRGKSSVNNIVVEYNFEIENDKIKLIPRHRGNPIDKVVSELMILANCSWGRTLTNAFIPAIYRVKQPNYPVRMTLTPDSHIGLNVDYYTWATSPLRRAADFINQYQIISLVLDNKKHYSATTPVMADVVENFDTRYAKYIDFQDKMERYFSLQYLLQEDISELMATFTYKSKVQLEGVPIMVDVQNLINSKPKGEQIRLKIYNINLVTLTFDFAVIPYD